ncbi:MULTISPECIES: sensor histidine kinase [Pseudomonadaceae]|uniref:sensor histidine kinase n=1 Tax=Pseudomonadaceae TaxID=135621 RepID=UPI0015E2B599|nr:MULTISPECIES: ATP-binding protein [Pseudomonadaceae]MBA1276442.1 sensor histidine kinase [Stutzerimonas stutzeri]MBC8648948.1 sensor histidine kinase [Pseudomonas sp. MT4]QXY92913.1 sensor histidine kinase [Pseudomonas sp. MTM4]
MISKAALRRRHRRNGWIFGLLAAVLVGVALWLAGTHGRTEAYAALSERAQQAAELQSALLRTVLEKQRSLPFVLAGDRDIRDGLLSRDAQALRRIDRKLEALLPGTQASVIYLLDVNGIGVAASNWREPTSFVGSRYDFRAYFRDALAHGSAEHYGLGNVSLRPGLYISRRVEGPSGPLGVIVVKVEFDPVERDWGRSDGITYVVDERAIVLATSMPQWRFMAVAPIEPRRKAAIRESLQFGDAPLAPLPITPRESGAFPDIVQAWLPGREHAEEYLRIDTEVVGTQWRLNLLLPSEAAVAKAMRESRTATLFALLLLLGAGGLLLYRRQKSDERVVEHQHARTELERRVLERTRALSEAHDQLQMQIDERLKAQTSLQTVQQELVQANRLAILGQVAAGVAHEINQPVAAIRAYADNARTYLGRGDQAGTDRKLEQIAGLTERIGTITDELRTFSRKGRVKAEPTRLDEVIEGALLLLGSRFRQRYGSIDTRMPTPTLRIMGTRIRLEQVLINLLQNGLEAVESRPDGRVEVSVVEAEEWVELIVSDNGSGIPSSIMEALFTPFNTSKPAGLGLGLVISKDIVSDFGGRIEVTSSPQGTRFTVYLQKAAEHE